MAEFDPTQPFEVISEGEPPAFDPTKPFEVVGDKPEFDPSKPFEVVREQAPSLLQRFKDAIRPGLEAFGQAVAEDPAANMGAAQAILDGAGKAAELAGAGLGMAARGAQVIPGPVPGSGVANLPRAVGQPLTPLVTLPRAPQFPDERPGAQVAAGAANVAAGLAEGVLSPLGLATLAAGSLSVGAQRLLAGVFAGDMARHLPDAAAAAGQALEMGSLQDKVETVGGLAATAGMTGLTARHAVTPNRIAAARGVAREIERAPMNPDATPAGAMDPAPRVESLGPKPAESTAPEAFHPAEVLEAADALMEVAPKALGETPPSEVAPSAAEIAQRAKAIREAAETAGAEGALDVIGDPTPAERSAAGIAIGAGDDLIRGMETGRVPVAAAESISRSVPGDPNAQAVGMSAIRDGATPEQAARAARAFRDEYGTTDAADVIADPGEMARLRGVAGLPAGTTPTTGVRMPVSVNRVTTGRQDIPGIMTQLEKVMGTAGTRTPIRVGRMGAAKRWASGFFRPKQEVIRLNSASNIPTATHEVAHALAREFWARKAGQPNSSGILRGSVPKPVVAEMRGLGVKLYGSRKPVAGYIEEGWAEFVRHYLTTDDVAREAPQTLAWFRKEVLPKHPEVAKELQTARDMIDVWRGQGARGRGLAMMKPYPGPVRQWASRLSKTFSMRGQVEQLGPLEQASVFWQQRHGKPLKPGSDPYLVATRLRGIGPSVLRQFIESGPVDLNGNRTGGKALADVLAPVLADIPSWEKGLHAITRVSSKRVRERLEDWSLYLWSKRTIERAGKAQETGLSLDDARVLFQQLDSPRFQLAADRYQAWWDDVLDYYAGAGPANAELVKAIKAGSTAYVPLPRVLEDGNSQAVKPGSEGGGGLHRMRGSGRPVYDVMQSTLRVAGHIIEKAHRDMVANTVIDLAQRDGMGWLVERVPISKVKQTVNVERLRKQLEDQGADMTGVPDNALLEYYADAGSPTGVDTVYPRRGPGGQVEWYAIRPEVFEVITGVDNPTVAAGMLPALAAWSTRTFKLGTVGLRAKFQMVTNPLRDAINFGIQGSGPKMLSAYLASLGDAFRAAVGPYSGGRIKPSEWWDALQDLGVPMANSIAHDIVQTRSALRGAFTGRGVIRTVAEPVNAFRELISGMESVPREAALRMKAAEIGWQPGMRLTPDQAVALTVAAKRVTTDFTAGGSVSRQANLYIPFYGVAIQGVRTAGRTLRAAVDPAYAARNLIDQKAALGRVVLGGTFLTGLTLANWLRNRDEDWYRGLPWRERFLYTHVMGDDGIPVKIPRPIEWGNLFMVLPEAIADSWYREDPETAVAAIEHIVASMNPVGLPPLANAILEQAANRDFFWDRPIVPRGEVDLPPGEQRSEYSSWVARALGDAFPERISPRRVDAAIRQLAGGTGTDLVNALGVQDQLHPREWEPADIPVLGTLFRRGGGFTAANRHINEFHDLYSQLAARSRSKRYPLDPRQEHFWKMLQREKESLDMIRQVAIRTKELKRRQMLWERAGGRARILVERAKQLDIMKGRATGK